MTQLSPRQLEYLIATIETGTVTGAAQQCHVSQSAVSVGLRELERQTGVELFVDDRTRGMVPTMAGRALAARAAEVLAMLESLPVIARDNAPGLLGLLRVGCFEALSTLILPDLVAKVGAANPALQIEFLEGSVTDLVRRMRLGELDLVIGAQHQMPGDMPHEVVLETTYHVVLSARHPLAGRPSIALRDLADEPAIFLDLPPTVERLDALARSHGVVPQLKWRSRSMATIQGLVARGLGYTIANQRHPDGIAGTDLPLVYLPIEGDLPSSGLAVAWRSGEPTANVRAVIEHLRAHADAWRFDADRA